MLGLCIDSLVVVTLVFPVLLYAYMLVYRIVKKNGQEEESGILLARAAIIQHGVIARPVENAVLHKLSTTDQVVFDEVVPLEQL